MPALSDQMLDLGCVAHVDGIHGEQIAILSGSRDAGKAFTVVRETETDVVLTSDLGEDRRSKRIIRFRDSKGIPEILSQTILQTEDGKQWRAVRNPLDGYLTTDFELIEQTAKDK